jgi:hypothetical protein
MLSSDHLVFKEYSASEVSWRVKTDLELKRVTTGVDEDLSGDHRSRVTPGWVCAPYGLGTPSATAMVPE